MKKTKLIHMKNCLLLIALTALFSGAFAQKKITLSFVGSPSANWMVSNNQVVDNSGMKFGYDFGLNADFYLTEDHRYSILSGLMISNTGGELLYQNNAEFTFAGVTLPASSQIRYKLRYVEIPLCLKLKTDQFGRMTYWGQLGLTGMVNIDSKGYTDDGMLDKTNINDEINLFNLAMNIGLGFDFDLSGNNSLSTGVVFQNGLIDVTTNNSFTDKTIINSLKLKIGVNF
jgi:hypothetical protein